MSYLAQAAADDEPIMETREASPSHFLIKIESFSLLDKHGIVNYETREFEAGQYKWRLIIYPNGQKRGRDDDYVSVYLAMKDTTLSAYWEVNVVFSICLFNHVSNNYHYALGRTRRFHAMKTEWGFSKFISKKGFTDPSNGYLIDDTCVFGAEVFVIKNNNAVTERLSLKNVTDVYKRDWKITNYSKLGEKWTSEEFTVGGRKWQIRVYPKGNGEANGRCLSIFIKCLNINCVPYERVKAYYTINLKNQISDEHNKITCHSSWFSVTRSALGRASVIELATLNDPYRGFIVDDCCELEIELSVQAIAA